MAGSPQTTTNPDRTAGPSGAVTGGSSAAPGYTTPLAVGSALQVHPGFPSPDDVLPSAETLWADYYRNVMRGDIDELTEFPTNLNVSRTYSDNNPPFIDPKTTGDTSADLLFGGGNPLGGMCPTVLSPGQGNGLDAASIPGGDGPKTILGSMLVTGHGTSRNGSAANPSEGSDIQKTVGYNGEISPSYNSGNKGWSG